MSLNKAIEHKKEDLIKKVENLEEENKRLSGDISNYIEMIENLEEEGKRLRKENDNTIWLNLGMNNSLYPIDTQIPNTLKEMKDYYLADNYKNPSKVRFLGYFVTGTFGDNDLVIVCSCHNYNSNKIQYYNPCELFPTKGNASDEYLRKKKKKWKQIQ